MIVPALDEIRPPPDGCLLLADFLVPRTIGSIGPAKPMPPRVPILSKCVVKTVRPKTGVIWSFALPNWNVTLSSSRSRSARIDATMMS